MTRTVEIAEWRQVDLPGLALSQRDRDVLRRWRDPRVSIEEMRSGLRVSTTSWVGVVRLETLEIRIFPKLPGGSRHLVRMIETAAGISGISKSVGAWELAPEGRSLAELLARLLAAEAERLVQHGLLSDYREVEAVLPAVRGRILGDRQILRRFGRIDQVWCRYDEYNRDTVDNRVVALGLRHCCRVVTDARLLLRLRRLRELFEDACDLDQVLAMDSVPVLEYDRLNHRYRTAHELARIVVSGTGVDDLHRQGSLASFAFALNMNTLFEDFVTKWLGELLLPDGLRIADQRSTESIIRRWPSNTTYSRVRPDILVQRIGGTERGFPVDAKYKRYDVKKVSNEDVYQAFLYAYAFAGAPQSRMPRAALIFPTDGKDLIVDELAVGGERGEARLEVIGLPLGMLLDELHSTGPTPISSAVKARLKARCAA